jgi:hypothetical protein
MEDCIDKSILVSKATSYENAEGIAYRIKQIVEISFFQRPDEKQLPIIIWPELPDDEFESVIRHLSNDGFEFVKCQSLVFRGK